MVSNVYKDKLFVTFKNQKDEPVEFIDCFGNPTKLKDVNMNYYKIINMAFSLKREAEIPITYYPIHTVLYEDGSVFDWDSGSYKPVRIV